MFIPIINNKSKTFVETIVIYFLIQAVSSALLILRFVQNQILLPENQIFNLCLIALIIKLSIAPLHSWFPPILRKIRTIAIILIFTLQKLQPFLFLFLNNSKRKLFFIFVIATCLTGSLSNIIQNNTKIILSYSRICQGGWLLLAMWVNKRVWIFYITVYFITIFLVCKTFIANLSQIYWKHNLKSYWGILFMSLAGIPPLLGFYPKIVILDEIVSMSFFFMILILLRSAAIDFFIYTRTFYINFYNKSPSTLWISSNRNTHLLITVLLFRRFSIFIVF